MNALNIERVVLYVDSKYRTTGVPENFSINLVSGIKKVTQIEVISAEIPYTFYSINTSNNVLCWTNGASATFSATVPPGNYTTSSFITVLQTVMNAQMAGFTLTYNREQFKITFANASAFRLDLTNASGTSTLSTLIGLNTASSLSTSVTPVNIVNIGGPKYLLIKSIGLTRPKITRPFLNTAQDDVLYKVAVNGAPGDILVEKNLYTNLLKYGVRQTIQNMDFQLVDDQNNQINLNGQDWSLTINLVTG